MVSLKPRATAAAEQVAASVMIAPPHVPVLMEKKPPTILVMPGGYDGGVGGDGSFGGGEGGDGGINAHRHISYDEQLYELVVGYRYSEL